MSDLHQNRLIYYLFLDVRSLGNWCSEQYRFFLTPAATLPPLKLPEWIVMNFIKNFITDEDGVTAIEYALIAALVSAVLVAAVTSMTGGLTLVFDRIKGLLT